MKALYLHCFDNKLVQGMSVVQSGILPSVVVAHSEGELVRLEIVRC